MFSQGKSLLPARPVVGRTPPETVLAPKPPRPRVDPPRTLDPPIITDPGKQPLTRPPLMTLPPTNPLDNIPPGKHPLTRPPEMTLPPVKPPETIVVAGKTLETVEVMTGAQFSTTYVVTAGAQTVFWTIPSLMTCGATCW